MVLLTKYQMKILQLKQHFSLHSALHNINDDYLTMTIFLGRYQRL